MSGIMITISILMVITICGAIGPNLCGVIKDVGLTYAGFILFNDASMTPSVAIGLSLSFAGATYFLWDKYMEEQTKIKEKNK